GWAGVVNWSSAVRIDSEDEPTTDARVRAADSAATVRRARRPAYVADDARTRVNGCEASDHPAGRAARATGIHHAAASRGAAGAEARGRTRETGIDMERDDAGLACRSRPARHRRWHLRVASVAREDRDARADIN